MDKQRKAAGETAQQTRLELAGKALQGLMSTDGFWEAYVSPMIKAHPELDFMEGLAALSVIMAGKVMCFLEQAPLVEAMMKKEGGEQ